MGERIATSDAFASLALANTVTTRTGVMIATIQVVERAVKGA